MELPKDLLAILEEFWTEEYESDYRRFIKKNKELKKTGEIEGIKAKYIGKWIGIKVDEVQASSETHRELYKRLKEKGRSGV
jgi:hypothetical protein